MGYYEEVCPSSARQSRGRGRGEERQAGVMRSRSTSRRAFFEYLFLLHISAVGYQAVACGHGVLARMGIGKV